MIWNVGGFQAMQKYKEAPGWWYVILLVLSFLAGSYLSTTMSSNRWLMVTYGRSDRCYQRADYITLVVIYYCTLPWCICDSRWNMLLKLNRTYVMSSAIFYSSLCSNGWWYCHKPIDENGCRCSQSWKACGQPLCVPYLLHMIFLE